MISARAALVGSSSYTVSLTAPTKRVTYQPIKSRPLSFSKCWLGSRHAANDGSGWSLEMSDLPRKRFIILTLTVFPIRSTTINFSKHPSFKSNWAPSSNASTQEVGRVKTWSISGHDMFRGEYLLLQTNISLSRETATVGSKKRKLFPTEILMGLDLEDAGKKSTAPPRSNVNLSTAHLEAMSTRPTHGLALNSMSQLNTMRPTPRTKPPQSTP